MKTMRASFELYRMLYAPMIAAGSVTDAMLRGAFSAGVMHGLDIARLDPEDAVRAIDKMTSELADFWAKELPQ